MAGFCGRAGEYLVQEGTFGNSERGRRTLVAARLCLLTLYVFLGVVFLVSIATYLMGRVEIVDHRMKVEQLEVPSVAICPWEPLSAIVVPQNASFVAYAMKYTAEGNARLSVQPRECSFDRVCMCLDLSGEVLQDIDNAGTQHLGATGVSSEGLQNYRERIEVHTTLTDPSPVHTLKIGFYDSVDSRPSWSYVRQWFYILGQLRLDTWLVSEARVTENLVGMLRGAMPQLQRRHFYTYTSSGADDSMELEDNMRTTTLSYEFKSFFIIETISARKSWSLFTFVSLLILLVALSNALMVWNTLFPEYVEGGVRRRTVARPLEWCASCLCGHELGHDHDEDALAAKKVGQYGAA